MRIATWVLTITSISFMGCANFQSIDRTTYTPANTKKGSGLAIHLDPQQRLVIFDSLQRFCAEPSPDALSAFTSAVSLSAHHPSEVAATLAGAFQGSTASIGLRTQSITLMRDALFRMCEAYMNGAISPIQVSTLLGRSQDLTAVILAVEQLTGAVAANQAAAGSGLPPDKPGSGAAAKNEEEKKKNLVEKGGGQAAEANASAGKNAENKDIPGDKASESPSVSGSKASSEEQNNKLGSAQFSSPVPPKELSKEATQFVAIAVSTMVGEVLKKKYAQDSCMVLLTTYPDKYQNWSDDMKNGYGQVRALCGLPPV